MPIRSVYMEELTSPEIQGAVASGVSTVVSPSGAVEQHGPHVAIVSDTLQARSIAGRLATRLGDTLVAPTIAVGCSEHHMTFAGTLSLRPETFVEIHTDYCRSLARHGFRRIALYPAHGGNFAVLRDAEAALRAAARPARLAAFTDLEAYLRALRDVVVGAGFGEAHFGGHADIAESSMVLALESRFVQVDLAQPGFIGPLSEVMARVYRDGLGSVSPNGVLGDPTGLNTDLGEACITRLVDLLEAYFRDPASWDGRD